MNDFHGLPIGILENDTIRLEYLTSAGPRIVRLSMHGGPNLLRELPDISTETLFGTYHLRGGHRLWCAPEFRTSSYAPDNDGLIMEEFPGGVRLSGPSEPATCIIKTIAIRLSPERAEVTLEHELRNAGLRWIEVAAWALTMLRMGGTAILPQPIGNTDAYGMRHNRILALWPYTHINDPRLILGDDAILMRARSSLPAVKIGYYNPSGWLAYWVDNVLFRKTFATIADATYPDGGCNAEVYCDNRVIELESLGRFGSLEPGKSFFHTEKWEIFDSLDQPFISPGLRERLEE